MVTCFVEKLKGYAQWLEYSVMCIWFLVGILNLSQINHGEFVKEQDVLVC